MGMVYSQNLFNRYVISSFFMSLNNFVEKKRPKMDILRRKRHTPHGESFALKWPRTSNGSFGETFWDQERSNPSIVAEVIKA